jgi:NADPH:quinone reductase-like Zn-dependent oxidoreductase
MSQPTAGGDAAPATMRAVVVTRPGGLDALEIKDVPVPVRKPGWVRIRVKAFGVNESEVTTRRGESDVVVTYPRVPGIEGVGVVDEAEEVSGLRRGQQVATMMGGMGRSYDGAYAQYVTVPAAQVIPFETGLPWEVVGALPEMFQTAYGSLTTGLDLKAGQTLLIRGGTSTVGLSAATIAKDLGATVLSTTRSPERTGELRAAGVDHPLVDSGTIASQVSELTPEGVDAVLELVGCSVLADTLRTVRRTRHRLLHRSPGGPMDDPRLHPVHDPQRRTTDLLRRAGHRPPGPRLRPPAPGHRRRASHSPDREDLPRPGTGP